MSKKLIPNRSGIVYSTDPNFRPGEELKAEPVVAREQLLRVGLDKKKRAGKSVTLITGFQGSKVELEELGRQVKSLCGTGGSVKDGEIIIQGEHCDKILQYLIKSGFSKSKKG